MVRGASNEVLPEITIKAIDVTGNTATTAKGGKVWVKFETNSSLKIIGSGGHGLWNEGKAVFRELRLRGALNEVHTLIFRTGKP